MEGHQRFYVTTALVVVVMVQLMVASGTGSAAPTASCNMRIRVELTPDVPQPLEAGFISSLLGNHAAYRLTLRQQDPYNTSVVALDLAGPAPELGCREVINSMRKDARVVSIDVLGDADSTVEPVSLPPGQPIGTVQAGPDGEWVLEPLSGVSRVRQARDRYECDIWASDHSGFDPTKENGGVPAVALPGKRADYLGAEAACFQARGYLVK